MNDKDRLMRREAQSSQLRNQRNDSKTQHLQKMTQEQNGKFYILKIRNIWISSIYNNSIQSRTVYLTLQLIPNQYAIWFQFSFYRLRCCGALKTG